MADRNPTIYAILEDIAKKRSNKDKVEALKKNSNINAIPALLKMVFDPNVKFSLPEGEPPFTPQEDMLDNTGGMYRDYKKMKYFMDHPQNNVHPIKRETVFIELLESVHPNDAKLLLSIKDKKLPFKGITAKVVEEAFPGIF